MDIISAMDAQAFRKLSFSCIKIVITIAIFVFLITKSQFKVDLFYTIFHKPFLALSVIGLFFIMILINAWRWHRLNCAQKIQFTFLHTIMPTYIGVVFNNLLPGNVGGDIARVYYLFKKVPDKKSGALLSVLFDRVTGLMGIFLTVCLIGFTHLELFNHNIQLLNFLYISLGLCLLAVIVFIVSVSLADKFNIDILLERKFFHYTWFKPIIMFFQAAKLYNHSKWIVIECLITSVILQIVMIITILILNKILNLPVLNFSDYGIAMASAQLANLLPITPGGIGIGEAAFSSSLLLMNPNSIAAYATLFFAFRFLGLISYLPGAIFYLIKVKLPEQQISLNN